MKLIKFEKEKKDLEQIIQDKNSDTEMVEMAEKLKNEIKSKQKI